MSQNNIDQLPLAITIGEPSGIGVDIILQIWHENLKAPRLPEFYLLCDPSHLKVRAKTLGFDFQFAVHGEENPAATGEKPVFLVHPLKNKLRGKPAQPNKADAGGIVEAIETAVSHIQNGIARAMVTLPINKKSLYDAGFDYPGHTEFLASLANTWPTTSTHLTPVMMLAGPELRAVPVTIHIPLIEVPSALTQNTIIETVTIAERDLRERFGFTKPRIAISGLNPHAGEEGAMGKEEMNVIAPAIIKLQAQGIDCTGPLPADTMFHKSARERYDLAVCMYHDQALIPAKALAFDETVNVTLGLPFVRTSPDHGTAYDIAGTGKANPASTLAAICMADEMTS
ncbi:MAG: 4-hydroxythreonine-4-phosphate dehydrogenase PdxA [Rhizobiaceae bacterium]